MLTVALTLLASALGEMSGLGRADQTLYDAAMERLSQPAPEDIVIIAIDEPSLARSGRWPWRRAVHATLIEKVAAAKPRAIGIDLILAEPDARDPEGDRALARALQSHSRIVLPVLMEVRAGSVPEALPPAVYVSDELIARGLGAGDLVRAAVPAIDGKGGGRPDLAEAGGKDAAALGKVLESVYAQVDGLL